MILKARTADNNQDPNLRSFRYVDNAPVTNLHGGSIETRFPQEGWARDTGSDKLIFLWEGQCKVVIDDTAHDVIPGDVVLVPKNSKFFIDIPFDRSVKCWFINEPESSNDQLEFLPIK